MADIEFWNADNQIDLLTSMLLQEYPDDNISIGINRYPQVVLILIEN